MLPLIACPCLALNLFILFGMTFPESRPPPHRYPILKTRVFQRFATWTRRHFVGTLTNLAARGDELLIARSFARLCVLLYREYCEILPGTVKRAETTPNMVYSRYLKFPTEELARFFTDSLLTAERVIQSGGINSIDSEAKNEDSSRLMIQKTYVPKSHPQEQIANSFQALLSSSCWKAVRSGFLYLTSQHKMDYHNIASRQIRIFWMPLLPFVLPTAEYTLPGARYHHSETC